MKKYIALLMSMMLIVPSVFAVVTSTSIGISMSTESFEPMIWMCDHRLVTDDPINPGRVTDDELFERMGNYAFEGEQISWKVLVLDKNGFEKIQSVHVLANGEEEHNCVLDRVLYAGEQLEESCNAMIGEEVYNIVTENGVAAYYDCYFTVESPLSMYGDTMLEIEVEDISGKSSTTDEKEYWYLNPVITVTIDGSLNFGQVRPGTQAYSDTLRIGNGADTGSGVVLDIFISGTDFYDPSSSGAKCPTTNQLSLQNFDYYATTGSYSTYDDPRADGAGYVPILYSDSFGGSLFYDYFEVMKIGPKEGPYYLPNLLSPGEEMSITFRVSLPEPCNGDFSEGDIYLWGEAI